MAGLNPVFRRREKTPASTAKALAKTLPCGLLSFHVKGGFVPRKKNKAISISGGPLTIESTEQLYDQIKFNAHVPS